MPISRVRWALPTLALALPWLAFTGPAAAQLPVAPEGFEVRLVAAVPAVEYPCQVATGPDGSLFVAEDPMDQVGPYEADNGRILLFRDGQEPVVYAEGFRAIFGMAWHDGALYVMHMPRLSVCRDLDGDGRAEEIRDLFTDLGQPAGPHLNDHIVSGLQFGMDGWLYISVGDRGIPGAHGPDGRELTLQGGGVVRCRPDGTALELFSQGTRNHLEPALDPLDNVFTYDNTDDGDGWWTRVTHHVEGGYYGYPYDYHDRTDRMLPAMAEYGGGSPCGALIYKEDAWPEEYRGVGFWAEWGKRKVHAFRFRPRGSTFEVAEAIDFVVPGEAGDFRPIDLALSPDGKTLYIADWAMGGWGNKEEKVGRVFAVTWTGEVQSLPRGRDSDPIAGQIEQLAHPAYSERLRAQRELIRRGDEAILPVKTALADPKADPVALRHLVWALDGLAGGTPEAAFPLIDALKSPIADVRAQAARALGQREVPLGVDPEVGAPLLELFRDPDPAVRLQAVIAAGRIGDPRAVPALLPILAEPDEFLAYSARKALRRINDWQAAEEGLESEDPGIRLGLLAAMELVYEPSAAGALIEYALDPGHPADERAKTVLYLSQAHRKVPDWDGEWWGTRPTQGRPPARTIEWAGTALIEEAVRVSLADPELPVRSAAIEGALEIGSPPVVAALRDRFDAETDAEVRAAIARALGRLEDRESLPRLVAALRAPDSPEPIREASLEAVEAIGTELATETLTGLLAGGELADDLRPRIIASLGRFRARGAVPTLLEALADPEAPVRAAAAKALGRIGPAEGVSQSLVRLLEDPEVFVRKAAIGALGALADPDAIPALIASAGQGETRFEATMALAASPDPRALQVYLAGLGSRSPDPRRASASALEAIRGEAAPVLQQLADRRELPTNLLPELRRVFEVPTPLANWHVLGPLKRGDGPPFNPEAPIDLAARFEDRKGQPTSWERVGRVGEGGRVNLGRRFTTEGEQVAYAHAEIHAEAARHAELVVGSDDTLTVWLNGRQVYDFGGDRGYAPDQGRFEVELAEGTNSVLVACANSGGDWQFSVALTEPAEYDFLRGPVAEGFDPDAFRVHALEQSGDPSRGLALFSDLQGLACIKCHVVGGEGGAVGPALSGVGVRYTRPELIDSVLYPSARIASGYESVVVATTDGRVLTGVIHSDTPEALEIQDAEANRLAIAKEEIEARQASEVSIMPSGLAEGLSRRDFADLIAYLESLKEVPPAAPDGP